MIRGLGAGCDDAFLERDRLAAVEHERRRRFEPGQAVDDLHLALFRKLLQPTRQSTYDRIFPFTQLEGIDLRLPELDTVLSHLGGLVDDFRCMQQRLRRNTTHVEAHAAEHVPALDEDHVHAEIGRAERRRVTARPCADNDQLGRMSGAC